jgi:DNA-binding beta-propeller fold protein YncE
MKSLISISSSIFMLTNILSARGDTIYFSADSSDIISAASTDGSSQSVVYEGNVISSIGFSSDKSTMWFTDKGENTFNSATPSGDSATVLHTGFSLVHDFFADEDSGYVYVCDEWANSIVKISLIDQTSENFVSTDINAPSGITFYDGNFYVSGTASAPTNEGYIYKISADGSTVEVVLTIDAKPRTLVNGEGGLIYYVEAPYDCDGYCGAVRSFDVSNNYAISDMITGLNSPGHNAVSSDGSTLYVTDKFSDGSGCIFSVNIADAPVALDVDSTDSQYCFAATESPVALAVLSDDLNLFETEATSSPFLSFSVWKVGLISVLTLSVMFWYFMKNQQKSSMSVDESERLIVEA